MRIHYKGLILKLLLLILPLENIEIYTLVFYIALFTVATKHDVFTKCNDAHI